MVQWLSSFVLVLLVYFSLANNTTYIPDCATNDDCPADRVCAKQSCINPCDGVCGLHTLCIVNNHVAMCSCIVGHQGHPYIGCSASPVVPTHPVCSAHDQCPATKACIEGKCQDPCEGLCGHKTSCTVRNHMPVCTCEEGHAGEPLVGCSQQVFQGCWPPLGKKKYYVETVRQAKWDEALAECIRNKSRLATVDNLKEFEQLRDAIKKTGKRLGNFYLSGTDNGNEGNYVWITNGNSLSPKGPMWPDQSQQTQPDNWQGNENCIEMKETCEGQGYYLNDRPCDSKAYYICEYYEI